MSESQWSCAIPVHNVMIDFETLATSQDAVAFEFGACYFNMHSMTFGAPYMHTLIDIKSQLKEGRALDINTIHWWLNNDADKSQLAESFKGIDGSSNSIVTFKDFLNQFQEWFFAINSMPQSIGIWSRGVGFDVKILEHMYQSVGKQKPWNFRKEYDDRTLTDLALFPSHKEPLTLDTSGMNTVLDDSMCKEHGALYDSFIQSRNILSSFKYIMDAIDCFEHQTAMKGVTEQEQRCIYIQGSM